MSSYMGRAQREPFFERHHFLTYLLLAGTGLALATLGVRRPEALEPVRRAGLAVTSPLLRLGSGTTGAVTGAWDGARLTWAAKDELATAEARLAELQLMVADRDELAAENERLRSALDLRERVPLKTSVARVIYQERGADAIVVIDKGSDDGLREDTAVISPEGVVGKVITVSARSARVQLVIDGDAGVAVMVGADRRQSNAIVTDGGAGRCRLRHLDLLQGIQVGDRVVTSGLDLIYPRGLLVGTVESVHEVPGVQQEVVVVPAVDFTRLEEVLVVAPADGPVPRQEPATQAPAAGRRGRVEARSTAPRDGGARAATHPGAPRGAGT